MGITSQLDNLLARRLTALRQGRKWSLDDAAETSGLSRATLSRFERAETSPTARQLGQLCAAFGVTMSQLLNGLDEHPAHHIARLSQPEWTDPETGFFRRQVSPPAAGFATELIEGRLPEGAVIAYDSPPLPGMEQHIWILEGHLDFFDGETRYRLEPGDALRVHLWGKTRFEVPGPQGVHYLVVVTKTESR